MKRAVTALLAGGAVFAGATAFAASLTVNGNNLGAGTSPTIAACDTDGVSVAYTIAWDATDNRYEVATAKVTGIDAACATEKVQLTLQTDAPAFVNAASEQSVTAGAATFSFTDDASRPTVESVTNVVVAVYDQAS